MQILKLKNIKTFVVISDVHLRDPDDQLTELFLDTLSSFKEIDAVFLLGDIFDFIAAKSSYFCKLWQNFFAACKNLQEKGIQVYFIEGNHDFGFEHFKSDFLQKCFSAYGDFIVEIAHKKLGYVHLRHGDDVVCKPNYLKFRKLVKGKLFQCVTSMLVPGWLMQFMFSRYAKISRKNDAYRSLPEPFLQNCLQTTIKIHSYINVLIIGHIHILRDCILENGVRFLVGPDWLSQPNYLIYTEEFGFERRLL